ncbi:MAG: DNA-binding transcriptional regulator [Verrucomicrobiales bacterium]
MIRSSSIARKRVAVLVYSTFQPGRDVLLGVAQLAQELDSWRLIHVPGGSADSIPDWLDGSEIDGIIARITSETMANALRAFNVPVVDVQRGVQVTDIPQVDIDDEAVTHLVAQYFFDREFRHIGFYPFENNREGWSQRRCESLRQLCAGRASFHLYDALPENRQGARATRHHVQAWLRSLPKPVAIMLARDDGGLVVLDACREVGLLVPEQVSVLGVDNDRPLCDMTTPPLSSVRVGHREVGYRAALLLDKRMAGDDLAEDLLLVPPLGIVTRRSSDAHAIHDENVANGVHYIHENLTQEITNESLARIAGMSRTLFQQRFRHEMGKTIRNYVTDTRLGRAKALLTKSDLSLAEIAWRVGFKRQEYMGHVFKTRLGVTPGNLRKASR